MSVTILATKLYIPPPRAKFVLRPRLIERLNEGLAAGHTPGVTLLSAPAGFGKTSLLSEWIGECRMQNAEWGIEPSQSPIFTQHSAFLNHHFCWLSLDEGENDPARFLAYLVAALQTVAPQVGAGVLSVLDAPQPQTPSTESVLTALLNEISALPGRFILVLDDYHVIDSKVVDQALAFLLEALPPQLHLVIATREDPPLPLARLRVRGQLTELRAADLRFTLAEATGFLNQSMGLQLSPENVAALEARTEGWIAGLQLAALALQGALSTPGRPDAGGFITSFTGSHHFVMDYLVEEVLRQQPTSVQNFLLRTSILGRLCGALCDALCSPEAGGPAPSASGQETLEYLERANLLIVPLDDQRNWYRYHHLFADVLQARLAKELPNQAAGLHLRASAWFEEHNFRAEAIHHALAGGDFARAADWIEVERTATSGSYFRSATWLGWVKALPDEVVRSRPRLSVGYAWELLFLGELEAAETRIRDAERGLEQPRGAPPTGAPATQGEDYRAIRASLGIARTYLAQAHGDVAGAVKHARQALSFLPETDYHDRSLANSLLGMSCLANGELETAYEYINDGMLSLRKAGNLLFATSGVYVLANIRIAQGRLFDAAGIYQEALQVVTAQGGPAIQGTVDLHLGLSGLYLEWGNLEAARQHLARAEELGELAALPEWPFQLYRTQANLKMAQGDLDGAIELVEKAEKLYHRSPVPDARPMPAVKARIWIRQGRLEEAMVWARGRGLRVDGELSYLREFEYVTLARLLIAGYPNARVERPMDQALGLLERLLKAAQEGGRMGSVIEILALQALAHQARGDLPQALAALERALALAAPEGYVRLFVEEGEGMRMLIEDCRMQIEKQVSSSAHTLLGYTGKLLAAFAPPANKQSTTGNQHSAIKNQQSTFEEPLSQRELEVLRLVAQGLSNQEIGRRLFLALNTVKGHNRVIFDKLQVQSRTEAVARARELGLL